MAVPAFLHDLIRSGVEFETDGKRVRWRNGKGRVAPSIIDMLRTHKTEIIRFLSAPPEPSRGLPSPVAAAVEATFEDYGATDDPYDERTWR